jgi:hypothetical protein
MASLQARHSRSCATGRPWTPFAALDGCNCRPTYYVIVREGRSNHAERVGKDRQTAERALRKIGVQEDDGSYAPQQSVRFEAWGERWRQSLERKQTTITPTAPRSGTPPRLSAGFPSGDSEPRIWRS